jgi:hypothetical protein
MLSFWCNQKSKIQYKIFNVSSLYFKGLQNYLTYFEIQVDDMKIKHPNERVPIYKHSQ